MIKRLLVMDRDPSVQRSVNVLLDGEGHRIVSVSDGKAALRCASQTRYDVVIAGQGNNGLSGPELASRFREIQPEARVIVAGERGCAGAVGALRAEAYAYFHKPLPDAPLGDMVQLAMNSGPWRGDIRVISASPAWLECEVRCKLDAAERMAGFVREIGVDLPGGVCEDVAVAFRELLLNAVEHGGKLDPAKMALVTLVRLQHAIAAQIQDPGPGFSLCGLPHAAVCNPDNSPTRHVEIREEEGRRPGGFGILMARSLVDEVAYNEPGNRVMFVKYLGRQE